MGQSGQRYFHTGRYASLPPGSNHPVSSSRGSSGVLTSCDGSVSEAGSVAVMLSGELSGDWLGEGNIGERAFPRTRQYPFISVEMSSSRQARCCRTCRKVSR